MGDGTSQTSEKDCNLLLHLSRFNVNLIKFWFLRGTIDFDRHRKHNDEGFCAKKARQMRAKKDCFLMDARGDTCCLFL
jgi:hypothetical protein